MVYNPIEPMHEEVRDGLSRACDRRSARQHVYKRDCGAWANQPA